MNIFKAPGIVNALNRIIEKLESIIISMDSVQTGMIVDFAGSSAPTGWLICNGAAVSKTTYAALFAITGHAYGADPGGGNFILPDCRGKATVGYLAADADFGALGNVAAGEKTHLLSATESGLPAHEHAVQYLASAAGAGIPNYPLAGGGTNFPTSGGAAQNAASAHNNIQPSIVFNKIIKY